MFWYPYHKTQNSSKRFRTPFTTEGVKFSVPNFEKEGGQKKISACGNLKNSSQRYCLGGLLYSLLKILKTYSFEGSITNIILACFSQTTN